jgi:hypothetical protein
MWMNYKIQNPAALCQGDISVVPAGKEESRIVFAKTKISDSAGN